jgi:RNA recognition motif-containing protein
MYNNFEVFIGRLQPETDPYELQKAFHKKGIRFVNLDVKCKEGKKGFAFLKCLTQKDMENAISLDGEMMFDGKKIEIRAAAEKKRDNKGGDRDHHHKKNFNKDY